MGLSVALVTRQQGNREPEMGRIKGAENKTKQPDILIMPVEQRINLLANLILEIVIEEQTK
jgi:hypothetical protein